MQNDPLRPNDESADTSFADILKEFESSRRPSAAAPKGKGKGKSKPAAPAPLRGTVVGVSGDFVLIDYGGKSEGVISATDFLDSSGNLAVKRGDTLEVTIT